MEMHKRKINPPPEPTAMYTGVCQFSPLLVLTVGLNELPYVGAKVGGAECSKVVDNKENCGESRENEEVMQLGQSN